MKKNILVNSAMVVISLLLGLLLSEFVYRSYLTLTYKQKILGLDSAITIFSDKLSLFDENFGYTYNPNKELYMLQIQNNRAIYCKPMFKTNAFGTFEKDSSDFEGAQNSLGKHGPRILVFGDSFTSIPHDGETWVSLFSKRIKEDLDPHAQVLNFGRDGYGIVQMLELAAGQIDAWKPDAVLFAFITDDLRRTRFWRKSYETKLGGYTYVTSDPADDETSADSKIVSFFDKRITKEWCDTVLAHGGDDPLISQMVEFYKAVAVAELNRDAPRIFAPQLYLFNRLTSGKPVIHHSKKSVNNRNLLKDASFVRAIDRLNRSNIPYYFAHIPTLPEMKRNLRWDLPLDSQQFMDELMSMTNQRPVLFLSDWLKLSKDELARFPVSSQDGHPSKDGIGYISEAMSKLFLDRDNKEKQKRPWVKNAQEVLTYQVNLSPLLDSPQGWGPGFEKTREPGGSGVVVGAEGDKLFAQQFPAKPNEQFRIIARASVPRTIWNGFGLFSKPAKGQFQINWAGSGKFIDAYIEPFDVTLEEKIFETYVIAPPGTDMGTLYVMANGREDRVRYTEMRLLGKKSD